MARISTYDNDKNIQGEDLLAGSNYLGPDKYNTKNFKIEDLVEFIEGQITISTQQATLKPNGGLVVENINSTDYLAVNLSHTNITGQLANSDLVNSSITINGTAVSLGGSITIGEVTEVTAGTYLNGGGTEGTVTLNHDDTSRSDTTSTAAPAYGDTFTAIDSITTNATGHITAANLKTVTIPASDNTNTTYTLEAMDDGDHAKIRLVGANPSSTDDINLKAGSNITINVNESTDEIEIVGTAFGNTFTVANETQHLALTTSSGDLVIRTDQSKTYIDNGNNVSPNEMGNYTELQFSGIQQIDLVAGDGIDLEDHANNAITTLTQNNNDLKVINTLATSSERGGIKIGYTESGKNYPVELDSEKAYVNVPWVNTNQLTEWILTDGDDDNTTINHGKHVKFVMATGALGTNTTGAGTDADPYLVTLTSPNTTYTAGNGLDLTGTEFSHSDTSSQTSVDNSGRTYIQDITLDTYGHVTGLVSATETVVDTNQLTTWDLLDDDDDSFTISHDKHVKFTSGNGAYGTNITGAGTSSDPYVVAITSPNDTVPDTTYGISCVDGDNTDEEKIRLTDSGGGTDDVVLEAGTGLSIARDGDKITYTNTVTDTTNWNFKVDTGTPENISAGETVTFSGTDGIALSQSGNTIDINHVDTSSVSDLTASSRTYVTALTFDTYGHVTGYSTDTETVVDTNQLTEWILRDDDDDDKTVGHNKYVKFTSAVGAAGTNVSGAGTTSDPFVIAITSPNDNDNDNYYLDGISKSGNILTFSVNGATNQTFEFGANAFNSTTIPTNNNQLTNGAGYTTNTGTTTADNTQTFTNKSGNISQWTNDSSYLTSYTETSTLANVVSRGNTTGGTLEVTGTGSWLTVEGNAANTSVPLSQGLAFGWNRSGGSNETEIIFRGSTSGHSSRLDIRSYDGSNFRTLAQFKGDEEIIFPNAGNIVAQENGAERILERSYDGSRWARLVSNSVGGELRLGRSNTAHVKIVTLGDSYLNGGDVGIGTTTPGTKLDVNGVITATGGTSTNWNTAYGWGNHASAGYLTSFDITTQTDPKYLRSNADDTSSGSLTVVSYKFNGNASNPTNTTATIYDQSGVGLTASAHNFSIRNYNGSSMVESARFTTSSLTVIGDVIAFGTPSDISFKENIKPIDNALDKVEKLQGVTFDWKESDSILDIKQDIGFIAQDVQKVLPELVRENDNGKLSLRHQGIISVLTEAIKELSDRIKVLENGSTK